ncbi:MAG: hypothetical protein IIU99_01605, partial [Treponema sp.]|nr:hypothetical protein [Treponema sp.]
GISAVSSAISFLCANPMVLLVAAIIALVALIAVKGDEIQAILTNVDSYVQGVFTKDWTQSFGVLGELMNAWQATIKSVWDNVMRIFNGIIDFIRGVDLYVYGLTRNFV